MTYFIKKDDNTFEKYSFFDLMMLSTLCDLIFKTPEKSNDSWCLQLSVIWYLLKRYSQFS